MGKAAAAKVCGIPYKQWLRLEAANVPPKPILEGPMPKYSRWELEAWRDAGCPPPCRLAQDQARGRSMSQPQDELADLTPLGALADVPTDYLDLAVVAVILKLPKGRLVKMHDKGNFCAIYDFGKGEQRVRASELNAWTESTKRKKLQIGRKAAIPYRRPDSERSVRGGRNAG